MAQEPRAREGLDTLLRALKLPVFVELRASLAARAETEGWRFEEYLHQLAIHEAQDRKRRRIDRLVKLSGVPKEKTLAALKLDRLSTPVRRLLPTLCEGGFVERAENVLAFGLPGRGKTHVLCAIANELLLRGYKVLFTPAYRLVQRLLVAKRALALERELRALDAFDVVAIDDIGYIQQDREEMEVLFTFLAERYERRSVMISSNLVFSQWDRIFKDPMTTAAAIDRIVHHAVILEMNGRSYRDDEAGERLGIAPPPVERDTSKSTVAPPPEKNA